MSYTIPQPSEERFSSVPGDNPWLLSPSAGSQTLEANRVYSQIETRFSLVHMALQPNFPPHEANTTDFYNYVQPHGITGHFTIQNVTEGHRKRTVGHRARPVCAYCNNDFGRVQELNRHMKGKHMPRRQCPFCNFRWTRPDGIKAHIVARHAEKFTAEMLAEIKALRGRRFIEFVDGYDHGLDLEPGSNIVVTGSSSEYPEPLPAVRVHQLFHQTPPDNAGVIWERRIAEPVLATARVRVNTPAARCFISQVHPL